MSARLTRVTRSGGPVRSEATLSPRCCGDRGGNTASLPLTGSPSTSDGSIVTSIRGVSRARAARRTTGSRGRGSCRPHRRRSPRNAPSRGPCGLHRCSSCAGRWCLYGPAGDRDADAAVRRDAGRRSSAVGRHDLRQVRRAAARTPRPPPRPIRPPACSSTSAGRDIHLLDLDARQDRGHQGSDWASGRRVRHPIHRHASPRPAADAWIAMHDVFVGVEDACTARPCSSARRACDGRDLGVDLATERATVGQRTDGFTAGYAPRRVGFEIGGLHPCRLQGPNPLAVG